MKREISLLIIGKNLMNLINDFHSEKVNQVTDHTIQTETTVDLLPDPLPNGNQNEPTSIESCDYNSFNEFVDDDIEYAAIFSNFEDYAMPF